MKNLENPSPCRESKPDLEHLKSLALSENGFLFDPMTGFAYNLNPTAITLVHQLQQGRTRAEILKYMEKHYEADSNHLETDLDQFLRRLEEYGLLGSDKAKRSA